VGHKGAGHDFAKAKSLPAHAAWIAAESPQDLHGQIRGIGAVERGERSTPRFFCRPLDGKKMRPNSSSEKFLIPHP
jgi:hypothetical protein